MKPTLVIVFLIIATLLRGAWTNTLGTSRLAWRRAAIERLFPTSTGAR